MLKIKNLELGAGMPKVIAPVTGKTRDEIIEQARAIMNANAADLIEWRADFYNEIFNDEALLNTLKTLREVLGETPLLFTLRTLSEGGEIDIELEDYARLNLIAAKSGCADIIDVEIIHEDKILIDLISSIKRLGCAVIGSKHDFNSTPPKDEIIKILLRAKAAGADILKIAVMPQSAQDVITLLAASSEFHAKYPDDLILTISMGSLGMASRIACGISGSCATFGAVGDTSAPGQIQAAELKRILNILNSPPL